MKKYLLILPLLLLLFISCHAQENGPACAELATKISNTLPQGEDLLEADADYAETVFPFLGKTDGHALLIDTKNSSTREIGIFHMQETSDLKAAEQEIRAYLSNEQEALRSLQALYPADELNERLWRYQNATVVTNGHYIAYFVLSREDQQLAKSTFQAALKA